MSHAAREDGPSQLGPTDVGTVQPLAAAKAPVGTGPIPTIGIVLSIMVVGVGVVGIHDALVGLGAVDGTPWIDHLVEVIDGWQPQAWLLPVGILLVLLGLWLLMAALRPRPQTGFALRAETGVYLRAADLQRLAVRAAGDVDGVISARSTASRRKVEVKIVGTGAPSTADRVRAAVEHALADLEPAPRVEVKISRTGGSS